jgi:hypothetical protein
MKILVFLLFALSFAAPHETGESELPKCMQNMRATG